jgi:IS5 family transposase
LADSYYKTLSPTLGRPSKDARIVIGAVIIKHKLSFSDEETVEQIRENPYLQYFIGLKGFQSKAPFAPSLLVEVRKRMGQTVFDEFHTAIIQAVEQKKTKKPVKVDQDGDDVRPRQLSSESHRKLTAHVETIPHDEEKFVFLTSWCAKLDYSIQIEK